MNINQAINAEQGMEKYFFRASAEEFNKIPGSPIAYWIGPRTLNMLETSKRLGDIADARMGMATGNNSKYVRQWFEVPLVKIGFSYSSRIEAEKSRTKWFPYCKGGQFRKWFGNNDHIVDWHNDGLELQTTLHPSGDRIWAHNFNLDHIFEDSITWSDVTSGQLSVRHNYNGFLFDGSGTCAFFKNKDEKLAALGLLNTNFANNFSKILNPTLHFQTGDFRNIPYRDSILKADFISNVKQLVVSSNDDWNSYETSWDFTKLPLLLPEHHQPTLKATYQSLRTHWRSMTLEIQCLEEENNRILIDAYGLQDELTPDVPLNEITLTSNPHYRYGGNKTEEELEALLRADTMREFISYAVGCMLGRYSLDKAGLILANQGETLADYLKQVPQPSFMPDKDNVIPMLDGDWFADDIVERFRQFLRVTFGEEHYEENLQFIEQALNIKGKKSYTLRDYFLGEFYTDHVKRYKKRPIYWLFSSPKGSFNALIYMHRYRPDTVSVVLNDYLREFRAKLDAHLQHLKATSISAGSSQGEKTKALKEIDKATKVMAELEDYERDVLYPLATQQIEIDLDDGVKANYPRFGAALKKIPGLDAKDDD